MDKLTELLNLKESLEEDKDSMPYSIYIQEKQIYINEIHKIYGLDKYIGILHN